MKRVIVFCVMMFVLSACTAPTTTLTPEDTSTGNAILASPGSDSLGDSYYPELGNGGYDALHYTIDLTWDDVINTIDGSVTMQARATQNLNAFNLDLIGLEVSTINVNDAAATFARKGRELTITPSESLSNGDTFEVVVAYSGEPEVQLDPAAPILLGWVRYEDGVYVVSEPSAAAAWYPVNDHPLDKATYSFRITVPQPYVVAANGLLQKTIDNGATLTYVWEARDPIASYLVTVDIADYVIDTSEGPNGLPIRNFFPRSDSEFYRREVEPTSDMIEYFSEVFGPYPFEAYGIVVAGDVGGALETQTLSVFAPGAVQEGILAHELVHQWFGDSVSLKQWQDIWLNEGFAVYGTWLWYEHLEGSQVIDDITRDAYEYYANASLSPPGMPPSDELFSDSVYTGGALVLQALRARVGDDAFFRILRTYADRFRYGNASSADFIAVAEEIGAQDLEAFFNGWLYGDEVPDIPEMGLSH